MSEFKFEIEEHLIVLSENEKGWKKELTRVSWNGVLLPTGVTFPFVLTYLVLSFSGCFVSPLSR